MVIFLKVKGQEVLGFFQVLGSIIIMNQGIFLKLGCTVLSLDNCHPLCNLPTGTRFTTHVRARGSLVLAQSV